MEADARAGGSSKLRPVREWGLDPMCFAHVRLLVFDLLSLRPVPNLQGTSFSFVQIITYYTIPGIWHGQQLSNFRLPPLHEGLSNSMISAKFHHNVLPTVLLSVILRCAGCKIVEPCSGSYARKGRPVRKVEVMGIVVTVDQKERYIRFTCKSLRLNSTRRNFVNPSHASTNFIFSVVE